MRAAEGPVLEPQGALCEKLGVLLLEPSGLLSVRIAVRLSVTTGDLSARFFCSLGSFKNGSTTKTRPTSQRKARRSCPHAHPEKKQNRAWRQRCCLKNRSGKAQRSRSSASPCTRLPRKKVEVPKISREPASCSIEQVAQCETVSHDRIQQRCVKRLDPVEKLSDDQKWTLSDASQRPLGHGSGEGC